MPRFTEEQLDQMCRPASDTEEMKMQNAESVLRKALRASTIVQPSDYEIFGQGSYANNTNIRLNSDIDINVCYTKAFYYSVPDGKIGSDYGLNGPINYSFQAYKDDIERMLIAFYGRSDVVRRNKCITVKGNTYRIQMDIVPTWEHRIYCYTDNTDYVKGVVLYADDNPNRKTINYPRQHIEKGIDKNGQTHRRFKRLSRILKNVLLRMDGDGYQPNKNITSFLLECLAYNVPTAIYIMNTHSCYWNDILRDALIYLWSSTQETSIAYTKWVEVSELLFLMSEHKWERKEIHEYIELMYNYLKLGRDYG